jgi:hypothetical protein
MFYAYTNGNVGGFNFFFSRKIWLIGQRSLLNSFFGTKQKEITEKKSIYIYIKLCFLLLFRFLLFMSWRCFKVISSWLSLPPTEKKEEKRRKWTIVCNISCRIINETREKIINWNNIYLFYQVLCKKHVSSTYTSGAQSVK